MSELVNRNIILWAIPRSISTAFFRTMESMKNCSVHLEPFSVSYYFGNERLSYRYANAPIEPNSSYSDVKIQLEAARQNKRENEIVFVKDMAYYIMQHKDRESLIPSGYRHTFLFRDPNKAVRSFYKLANNEDLTGWNGFDPSEVGFKELWELYQYVRDNIDPNPIVIDADDMILNPEACFRSYCNCLGIEFDEAMLNWNETGKCSAAISNVWQPWFEGVLSTNTFIKPQPSSERTRLLDLPHSVNECIMENMGYYNKFMEVKLKFIQHSQEEQ